MAKVSDAHLEARRRSIVLAACSIFSRKGVESATMAEIAAEAGLSPGAIYRYFENKDELARGCLGENAHDLEERWKLEPETTEEPMAEFARLSRLTFGTLNEPGESLHTMLMLEQMLKCVREGNTMLAGMRAELADTRNGIRKRLELAQKAGQLAADVDCSLVAGGLFSFYLGARFCKLIDNDLDTDGQLEQVIGLLATLSPPGDTRA